jgi:hypothetical protein
LCLHAEAAFRIRELVATTSTLTFYRLSRLADCVQSLCFACCASGRAFATALNEYVDCPSCSQSPYTFIVVALLILILAPAMILRTPTDIFPDINIPVIAVAWQYTGVNPEEMEGRITTVFERVLTIVVDNIEHVESVTVNG